MGNLLNARLESAYLDRAKLQGAYLQGAWLRGANSYAAQLQGSKLYGAQLQGAYLEGARIWKTAAPDLSSFQHAVPTNMDIVRPSDDEASTLVDLIAETKDERLKSILQKQLGPLLKPDEAQHWEGTKDHQTWIQFSERSKLDPAAQGQFVAKLACNDQTGGYIIKNIAAQNYPSSLHRIYQTAIARAIVENQDSCTAAEHLDPDTWIRLRRSSTND